MAQIYQNILVKNLGEPPRKIKIQPKISAQGANKTKNEKSEILEITPHEYMKNVLKLNPDNWVFLAQHPNRQAGVLFQETDSVGYPTTLKDREGIRPPQILNLTMDDLLIAVESSIRAGIPVTIAANIDHDIDSDSGIMHPQILKEFLEVSPEQKFPDLTVSEAARFGVGEANHIVMISGYDKPDPRGPTVKYKVVNSWGDEVGDKGFFHMYREWAEKYLGSIIVPKYVLPIHIRKMLKQKPVVIEDFWNRDPDSDD
jgi:bleomycin hydrolase